MRFRVVCLGLFVCLYCISSGLARQSTDKPAFEVVAIHPSDPNVNNPTWIGMSADAGIVHYTNITLRDCIRGAYRVRDFQIQGPAWMNDLRFEITAKIPSGTPKNLIPEMLRSVLDERFHLTFRREQKEMSVFALVVGQDGPNLKQSQGVPADFSTALGPDGNPRPAMIYSRVPNGVKLAAPSAKLGSFVELMSRFTERPVVDLTGLDGDYDITLTFAAEALDGRPLGNGVGPSVIQPGEPAPSVADAVRQYGLKIETRKVPMDLLVVTHLEKTPTDN
jgi:uncharacterized protein (TIGR03435 family)